MSLRIPKNYYNYLPFFLISGLDLALGGKVDSGSDNQKIKERNQSMCEITLFAISTLAYAAIFHVAPRLGYTIPQPVLLAAGLIFPSEAVLVIQARTGIKSIKEAVIQGR